MLHYCLVLVTDPLYLPLKRGGLVCPPLKSPVGSLCNYFIAHVFHLSIRTIGLFHPHGKSIRVQKTFALERNSCSKKSVFICVYPCAKNIRFVFKENSCSKKAVRPSPTHQCRTQADHLYLICHARRLPFPSPDTTITSSHHFTTFLPFTIYIP